MLLLTMNMAPLVSSLPLALSRVPEQGLLACLANCDSCFDSCDQDACSRFQKPTIMVVYTGFSRYGVLYFYGCMNSEYVWATGVEASHVCPKLSQRCVEVCILERLLNHHFINHHLRVPETWDLRT